MGLTNMEIKMTPSEIINTLTKIENAMIYKGYFSPSAAMKINWCGYELTLNIEYRTQASEYAKNQFFHENAKDGMVLLFSRGFDFVEGLPSIQEAKRNDFIASIGRLIDQGRAIGIEVEFMNPLTEMMGKLSTNIIEYKE